jgi:predicted dehydrogenase
MKKIRLAVVGPGLIGKKHINIINSHHDVELMAIIAPDHKENWEISFANDVPMFFDLKTCLAENNTDGVIISSPNEFHFEQAALCLNAGIPVLIEKPVTVDSLEGEKLLNLSNKLGSKALVGHHRTYSPLMTIAKDIIRDGRIGRLVSVMGSAQFYKPSLYFKSGPWRTKSGGGPILINMIHEIGNLRALMGEIASVQAVATSSFRGFTVEDTVAINFIFSNGALGTFMLSDTSASPQSWEQTSGENPAYPNYRDVDCYNIAGTRGSLSFPTMKIKYFSQDVEPSWWNPFEEEIGARSDSDPLLLQLDHFIQVIKGEEEPRVSISDGLKNLQVTEAIKASIEKRSIIDLLG